MVEISEPKKDETILDPACGTAGFLISAYKHILKHNTKDYQAQHVGEAYEAQGVDMISLTLDSPLRYSGDMLTPDDRKRLATNFGGYDISPDMVRLSLVNMYLHGFTDPHIEEYDTLTSDEKWNQLADVILANPPFMSPKGGIKPHKRFSVQAKRSEVLFVDYIAEHLTPNGRAAVVVPEGIIFQSQTAYKQLREMLVKGYLVAVISLPAGVFNPYSGVKTSILVMDKRLAKKSNDILFIKADNDGFNLGAQRRAIEKNDLPAVVEMVKAFRHSIEAGTPEVFEVERYRNALVVSRKRISENGEWNFTVERYLDEKIINSNYPLVKLGDIFTDPKIGGTPPRKNSEYFGGGIPWVSIRDMDNTRVITKTKETLTVSGVENSNCKLIKAGSLLMSFKLTVGRTSFAGMDLYTNEAIIAFEENKHIDLSYLSCLLPVAVTQDKSSNVFNAKSLNKAKIKNLIIPLPPLNVQKEIVTEIERYQKIIDGARQVVENYRSRIPILPDWPMVELGEVCQVRSGGTPSRNVDEYWNGDIPWITTTLIDFNTIEAANEFITLEGLENSSTWIAPKGTVLMAMYGQGITRGRVAVLGIDAAMNQACAVFQIKSPTLLSEYLFRALQSSYEDLRRVSDARGGNQSNLSAQVLKQYRIPLPDIDTQRSISAEIEEEQRLVDANRQLILRFEAKIKQTISRVWGDSE